MLNYILPFLILILIVVFIHEYGHYYFAKKYGVGVTDFSIGFGKEIFGWNDKSGTRWKICWINERLEKYAKTATASEASGIQEGNTGENHIFMFFLFQNISQNTNSNNNATK